MMMTMYVRCVRDSVMTQPTLGLMLSWSLLLRIFHVTSALFLINLNVIL